MRKTKSDFCMVAVSEMAFQRKRNPETYPCTPLFLTVCNHRNDYCHRCDYIRYSHRNDCNDCNSFCDYIRPSGKSLLRYSEGILPTNFFSLPSSDFFSLPPLHFLHFCTMGMVNFFKG